VAATSLIVAVTALDLIPNSLFSNYPYFLSGALLSASAALIRSRQPGDQRTVRVGEQPIDMRSVGYGYR
jgi:hypothetical protein